MLLRLSPTAYQRLVEVAHTTHDPRALHRAQALLWLHLRCGKVDIESLECLKPTRPCPMLSSSIKEVGDGEHQVVGTSW